MEYNQEESKKKILEFLQKLDPVTSRGAHYAYSEYFTDQGYQQTVSQGPCHALLEDKRKGKILGLGTGFLPRRDQSEIAEKFLSWIFGETSPWKVITQRGCEVVRGASGLPVGVYIDQEVMGRVEFNFVKNFCIALRHFTEKYDRDISTWNRLTSEFGLDNHEAYYLCHYLFLNRDDDFEMTRELQGWHSPITDTKGNSFYWPKFYSGDVKSREGSQLINSYWCKKGYEHPVFSVKDMPMTLRKGRFSHSYVWDAKEVIKNFKKWKRME